VTNKRAQARGIKQARIFWRTYIIKVIMNKASRPDKEGLLEELRDPSEAAAYLTAALEDGSPDVFLLALRDVAEVHGMKRLAEGAQLNRESMYRMLSDQGNPQLLSLTAILRELGLRLAIEVGEPVAA